MRIDGALHARVQHRKLVLNTLAHFSQRRLLKDKPALPENRRQQIFTVGARCNVLPMCGIKRIDNRKTFG